MLNTEGMTIPNKGHGSKDVLRTSLQWQNVCVCRSAMGRGQRRDQELIKGPCSRTLNSYSGKLSLLHVLKDGRDHGYPGWDWRKEWSSFTGDKHCKQDVEERHPRRCQAGQTFTERTG